jgi:hypothetical protein
MITSSGSWNAKSMKSPPPASAIGAIRSSVSRSIEAWISRRRLGVNAR